MDSIFVSDVPDSKGTAAIQKLYASDTVLASGPFNRYVLLKISDDAKVLCKFVPQPVSTDTFAVCDSSVVKHAPNKPIDPSTVKLNVTVRREDLEPIDIANVRRMVVSVVFKDVNNQNLWSKNLLKLGEAVKHLLRLFVVHDDSVVHLKRLGAKQNLNIDFILVHKTGCKNNAARIVSDTTIMVVKTMSTLHLRHAEIGLEVQPLFGMEPQVSCLKKIIKAAKNGSGTLCNMVTANCSTFYIAIFQ